jgi:hypothetical protein
MMSLPRRHSIHAVRDVPHQATVVYEFLAHLDNHWRLGGRSLRIARLDADRRGARILMTAPLGLRRTARTTVTNAQAPYRLSGIARVGRYTRADVGWSIDPTPRGAKVTLHASVGRAGAVDRALLVLGGRWWIRRAFDQALEALADALAGALGGGADARSSHLRSP